MGLIGLGTSVIEKAWETEKDSKGWGPGGQGIVVEASDYLIPLLDAEKDQPGW